jgi:hypothetical protein
MVHVEGMVNKEISYIIFYSKDWIVLIDKYYENYFSKRVAVIGFIIDNKK